MNETPSAEQALLEQLTDLISRHAPSAGTHRTIVPALSFLHAADLSEPLESVCKPSLCIVAQGAKASMLAHETYRYDPSTYVVTSVELPIISSIVEASPDLPYLGLKLSFDLDVILDMAKDSRLSPAVPAQTPRGIAVSRMSPELLDAAVRLVRLLDKPEEAPILAPLVIREILYRVLQGEQGALIHSFAVVGSHAHRIAQAIQGILRQYDRPLLIEQLAKSVNMSASAFHNHFKRVTAMSPLQYQKTVRLQQARRFMLTEHMSASDAAFRVGYESPSQFSREYARMYGRPPKLDIQELLGSHA